MAASAKSFYCRAQMGTSLGFHFILACFGMVIFFFMATSDKLWLKSGDKVYRKLRVPEARE